MLNFTGRFAALEDLIVATDHWQTWVNSADDTTLRNRVTWPVRSANLTDYPYINLSPGRGKIVNATGGYSSSANFKPLGSICLRLWDRDADVDNPAASFETFEANVDAFVEDLIEGTNDSPLIITSIDFDEPAIVHSHDNAFLQGEDGNDYPVWLTTLLLNWGVA
jgi:hypothetical protein